MVERLRRTVMLSGFVVAQAVAVLVTHHAFVATTTGRYVDTVSLTGSSIGSEHIEWLVNGVLDIVSVASVLVAFALVVVVALLRRRFVLAAAVATMMVGANVTTQLLKRIVLDRPDTPTGVPGAVGGLHNTLPSGHTTVALSVAVALVLVVPARLRGVTALAAAAYGALTGVATLSAQWHRPSDAIAAGLVVGAWAAAVGAVSVLLSRRRCRRGVPRAWSLPLLAVLGVLLLVAGAVGFYATTHTTPDALTRADFFVAYAAGAAAIAGACCALVAGVLTIAPWVVADDEYTSEPVERWSPSSRPRVAAR